MSKDGGSTFTQTNLMGSATSSNGLTVNNMGKAGEFWISAPNGLWHSTDFGHSIIGLSGGLQQAWAIAAGMPSVAGATPSIFAAAEVSGVYGLFRSDNNGGTWTRACLSLCHAVAAYFPSDEYPLRNTCRGKRRAAWFRLDLWDAFGW